MKNTQIAPAMDQVKILAATTPALTTAPQTVHAAADTTAVAIAAEAVTGAEATVALVAALEADTAAKAEATVAKTVATAANPTVARAPCAERNGSRPLSASPLLQSRMAHLQPSSVAALPSRVPTTMSIPP